MRAVTGQPARVTRHTGDTVRRSSRSAPRQQALLEAFLRTWFNPCCTLLAVGFRPVPD